ncbi:MAG: acetyl-CoA carboxylase carboxyltransferase subunit alpha [Calditrichaeota bacterium]|nr:MAG: acetyl-CoA carboxylase carboxyltransferase subunit alpha [Calditrichota bacterium]MBL1207574.1 acetyl-CoA carboxylase carboxyltransferase subunit alpha [Calditrichota bacterium]NOG47406.1 acetyl-CoA carboxylase carboxyltransferase subunit alpha [Calditrichota bacterium]
MANNSAKFTLEFEKPVFELETKIKEMKEYALSSGVDMAEDIERLETKTAQLRKQVYSNLSRWQRVQLARHPQRPYTLDYIGQITDYFEELHGDRYFSDDKALVAGLAKIDKYSVIVLGQQKGRDTKSNLERNFGMSNPEGYRKALRVMQLAAKFGKPIITLIDTPGAYPGLGAEERGQAEAIAKNLLEMSRLPVPVICVIIGEGASGGALGIGIGDRILMMENAWYSVISPEGCAAILWRDSAKAPEAAEAMKVTAPDLVNLEIVDEVIKEPEGGAHTNLEASAKAVKKSIVAHLKELVQIPSEKLIEQRIEKFGKMGAWEE